jgi:hypothetical protein
VVMFFVSVLYARRLIGVQVRTQIANLREVAVACCVLAACELVLRHVLAPYGLPSWLEFAAVLGLGGAVYGATLMAFGMRPAELAGLKPSPP